MQIIILNVIGKKDNFASKLITWVKQLIRGGVKTDYFLNVSLF